MDHEEAAVSTRSEPRHALPPAAELRPILGVVARLRWRIRTQRAIRSLVAGLAAGAFSLVVAMLLHAVWVLPPSAWDFVLLGAAGAAGLALLVGALWRIDALGAAAALDRSNDLKDRVGTALSVLRSGGTVSEFQLAQLRDAARHAASARTALAAPWRFPREALFVMLFVAGAWGLTWLQLPAPTQSSLAVRPFLIEDAVDSLAGLPPALPKDPERDLVVDPEQHDAVKAELQALEEKIAAEQKTVEPSQDAEGAETLAELQALIDDVAHERVSDREATKRLAELDEKLDAANAETPEETAQADAEQDAIEEAAKALDEALDKTKLSDPEMKQALEDLAKDLENKEYEKASDALEKLMEKFLKLPPKDQQRLAEMFKGLAKKFESPLLNEMKKLKDERDRLSKKNEGAPDGGSKKDKDRLNKLDRQLDKLSRSQQGSPDSQKKRELDRLSRDLKDLADKLRRQQEQDKQNEKQNAENQPENEQKRPRPADQASMEEMKKMLEEMKKRQSRQRTGQRTKMKMADVKELMKQRKGMGKEERMELEKLARGEGGQGGSKGGAGQKPGDKPGEKGGDKAGDWKQIRKGLMNEWRELAPKDSAGAAKAAMLGGPETDLAAKMEDDQLTGQKGAGESNRLVLKGAAAKGTGVKGYGELQIDYSMRAARQMQDEAIPPGYREYVEEYFRLIRER